MSFQSKLAAWQQLIKKVEVTPVKVAEPKVVPQSKIEETEPLVDPVDDLTIEPVNIDTVEQVSELKKIKKVKKEQ